MERRDQEETVQESATVLCSNGCGFFGSAATNNMCSVCFKKSIGSVNQDREALGDKSSAAVEEIKPAKACGDEKASVEETSQELVKEETVENKEGSDDDGKKIQKNKKRCWSCRKKVGLVGIECRCGYVFCGSHRYPQQHDCTFDFKTADRKELAKRNPGGGHFAKVDKL